MALIDAQLAILDEMEKDTAGLAAAIEAAALSMLVQFRQTRLPMAPDFSALPAILAELTRIWTQAIRENAAAFALEFPAGFPRKAQTADIVSTFVSSLRPRAAQQILETTQRQVRDLMAGGLASGESADAVYAELLLKIPEISSVRSLLITRTEAHAAGQFASWQLARQSLVPLIKVWNSIPDLRTRDFGEIGSGSIFNHRIMNGQRAGLNAAFSAPRRGGGAEQLMFPGDPRGSAANVINCRCIQTYERV